MHAPNGSPYICYYSLIYTATSIWLLHKCSDDQNDTTGKKKRKQTKTKHTRKNPKLKQPQVVGLRPCYFVIHLNLLIVISPNGEHKRNLYICVGSSVRKEQSAVVMKGTEKSAISQPLPYNICCNISDYIKAVVAHPSHGTARIREKQTWHQTHSSSRDRHDLQWYFSSTLRSLYF